tara:strand:+ start:2590 stop:2970 length:381 start_codon:yes stop_codon:yes gene_type:complete
MTDKKDDGVLRFSLALAEVDVELKHPETGEVHKYILREMDGTARDTYLSFVGTRMAASGDSTLKNFDGIQANLLHACIFRIDGDKQIRVPIGTIQKFPSKVLGALFDKAKEISGMDDDAEAEAGND